MKFGASAVTSAAPVTVATAATGGVVTPAQELFATSQFFELSDEDRISKPAFIPFDAGGTLQGDAWQVSDPQTADLVYEESLGEPGAETTHQPLDALALGWTYLGAAGRVRPALAKPAVAKLAVTSPSYAIASATTGEIVSTDAAAAVRVSMRRSADTINRGTTRLPTTPVTPLTKIRIPMLPLPPDRGGNMCSALDELDEVRHGSARSA